MLKRDYLDVPNTVTAWQTLVTPPIYIKGEKDTLTIGFTGSKQGATDFAWRRYGEENSSGNNGDQREGWWCATDFRLLFHPVLKRTVLKEQWGAVCLPYAYRVPKGMKLYSIAGLHGDYTKLCLEEVEYAEAGMPYIYWSEDADVVFYANGEAVKTAGRGDNNLRGNFETYSKAQVGYYLLKDGVWVRTTVREDFTPYSASIPKTSGMTILTEWDGVTMPIQGVEDELGPSGVDKIENGKLKIENYYDLQGRPVKESQRGVVIKQNRKQFVK
jgi:hypothetical protein